MSVCRKCNNDFSHDEEYFVAFLSAVRSGTTDPTLQVHLPGARVLARSNGLRKRIEGTRREYKTIKGDVKTVWTPDLKRIRRIVIKNARGHAMYELGEPMLDAPSCVSVLPLDALTNSEREAFEDAGFGDLWPEVGSRMMTRLLTGQDLQNGWVIVQGDIYRYAVNQQGMITVRSVIHEYLATEVVWDFE